MQNHYWVVERWTEKRGWHFWDAFYARADAREAAKMTSEPTRIRKFLAA